LAFGKISEISFRTNNKSRPVPRPNLTRKLGAHDNFFILLK
jgi:hypothetical protein